MPKRRSKGDGAIYFDERRDIFVGQIGLGYYDNGKRKRKTVYGKTKKEVRDKLRAVELKLLTGSYIDKSSITIYQLAKQLLDDRLNQNEIKPATYYRHVETLKVLEPIYNSAIQDATETQIKHFLSGSLHYSQSTINKFYELLKRTFREAMRRKIITENPMEYIKRPNSRKESVPVRALTKAEQKRLIYVLQTEDINYSRQMLLSLSMGLRMGEVNALHVEDVNLMFDRLTVQRTISKGEKGSAMLSDNTKTEAGRRILNLTADTRALLVDCIGDKNSGIIFSHNNKLITTNQVNAQFQRVLQKYNILDENITDGKVDLHSLRHTFATRCAEAGMPPKVLQEIMGHTDIRITMNIYFSATAEYMKENIDKVDAILKTEGLSIGSPTTFYAAQIS